MNRRKKLIAGVLALCVVGLILDKTVFQSIDVPATVYARAVGTATEEAATAANKGEPIPELPFPFAVARFKQEADRLDPFRQPIDPESLATAIGREQNEIPTNSVAAIGLSSREFSDAHNLSVILKNDRTSMVVIDEAWFRIGDSLDGCKLAEISGTYAVFACHDGDARLTFQHASE
ncbi:MAG: hypothetical protein ACPGXK_02200 [Phycisphaerae bacterium]